MKPWQGRSRSAEQTMTLAHVVARHARAGDVVALSGELGAGKTVFVRGLARAMGIAERNVTSPTFVMVHEYAPDTATPREDQLVLVHIDAYRLDGPADLTSIGWDSPWPEMRRHAVVAVEWADRIEDQLGHDRLDVRMEHVGESERAITITPCGSWLDRFAALHEALDTATAGTKCPICARAVRHDDPAFPFCSDRCRLIDLGRWIDGRYVISRPLEQSDLDEE